jgi:tetratricopeptide (TPR) repeat protein
MRALLFLIFFIPMGLNAQGTLELINNKKAKGWYEQAQALCYSDQPDYELALIYLNKADSLEPNNPLILAERGLTKFNSGNDPFGGITDLENSLEVTTHDYQRKKRYLNLGLCKMLIGDITAACILWEQAQEYGQKYIQDYCSGTFDPELHTNPDNEIEINLDIQDSILTIVSSHNPQMMSDCFAQFSILNNSKTNLTFKHPILAYGLESEDVCLYMEAIDETGMKLHFYSEIEPIPYEISEDLIVKPEERFTAEENLTSLYHFPYPGIYRVRLALRPTSQSLGFKNTHYSNWEIIVVN